MIQPITVRVHDVIEGPLCISLEDGQRLHDRILPLLQEEKPIALSFERIDAIIPAFLGSAIGQLYGELPEDHIDRFLSVRDMADDDREVLDCVVRNAKVYLSSPEEYDRAWREEMGDDEYEQEEQACGLSGHASCKENSS